jgi:hypothetical protein
MRFNPNSVLLNDGVAVKVPIHLPSVFDNLPVSAEIWTKSVMAFNTQLNTRKSVTEQVNGKSVDVLQFDAKDVVSLVVHKADVKEITEMWFSIKGQIVYKAGSMDDIEEIAIKDLIYKGLDGEEKSVLIKS